MELRLANVPVNMAYDIIVRAGQREYPLATQPTLRKGSSIYYHYVSIAMPPPTQAVELDLRSGKKAARNTVDVFEMWQGELVFPDLRVVQAGEPATASAPGVGPRRRSPTDHGAARSAHLRPLAAPRR